MPNWVYNVVTLSGDRSQELYDAITRPHKRAKNEKDVLTFMNIIEPTDWESYECGPIRVGSEADSNPNNWYDWNIRNWGTKWDCGDYSAQHHNDGSHTVRFSTAWSPPDPIIEKLAELAHWLDVDLSWWWEEEQGFGAEWELSPDGALALTDSWDSPASHADNKKRDNPCICEWGDDDPKYWFDDCPRGVA